MSDEDSYADEDDDYYDYGAKRHTKKTGGYNL